MKSLVLVLLIVAFIAVAHASSKCEDYCKNVKKTRSCLKLCMLGAIMSDDWSEVDVATLADAFETVTTTTTTNANGKQSTTTTTKKDEQPKKPAIDNNKIWSYYRTEVAAFLTRGVPSLAKNLQLVRKPIVANWEHNGDLLAALCNKIPQWGSEFVPSEKSLPEAYGEFLNNIKAVSGGSPADVAALEAAERELAEATERLAAEESKCRTNYDTINKLRPGLYTWESYVDRACAVFKRARVVQYDAEYAVEQARQKVVGQFGDVFNARKEYANAVTARSFPWAEIQGNLATFVSRAKEGKSTSFSITITRESKAVIDSTWETSATIKNDTSFVNVTESGKTKEFKFTTPEDRFRMEIDAPAYTSILVAPSKWMQSSIISGYANGPFVDTTKVYFGAKGSLPMMVRNFHIVYGPSVSLYLTATDANALKALKESKEKVSIGPFNGSADLMSFTKVSEGDETTEATFKVTFSAEEKPLIIAVDENVFSQ